MAEFSSDFDFIDDESGGRFVPVGGPLQQLRSLLARAEIDAAVSVYEESGGTARAGLLEEAESASFDTRKSIAMMFKRARDFAGAGRVYEIARLEMDAAAMYEQAGAFGPAGACYRRAGELHKAAACLERGGKGDEALDLYRSAGAHEALAECLARQKRFEEAAAVFRSLGNAHAEVEVLRAAIRDKQDAVPAARRLAELMVVHGHPDKAAQLLLDTARLMPKGQQNMGLLAELAQVLEMCGNTAAAEKVRAKIAGAPAAQSSGRTAPATKNAGPDGYGFLKALPMFAELSLGDMKALYRICTEATFSPGQNLIQIGQPGSGLFVIVDGMVEVYGGPDASSRLLNTMGAGAFVGEISLVQDSPTSARVTARSAVKALFVSRNAFAEYLYNNTAAALCIYRLFTINLAERVRALSSAR